MTENLRPTRAEATDVPVQYWMGQSCNSSKVQRPLDWDYKEYVADNESVGDTDSQDAAVSSKNLTELSDDESETGNSQTGAHGCHQ
ncbi:hypothetical protein NC651_026868 [Populus alba x Populus x berolinensis]|nr:hypothetical protein NC651_026868 [Populus alba x Populus x berolinensis]